MGLGRLNIMMDSYRLRISGYWDRRISSMSRQADPHSELSFPLLKGVMFRKRPLIDRRPLGA
jgi:hypothetical protein